MPGVYPRSIPLTHIQHPTEIDVLCGRGVATNRHVGNASFRALVKCHKEVYVRSTKMMKMKISRYIVADVRARGGRFLERDNDSSLWFDVGDKKATEKTSQALRDGAAPLRKKLLEEKEIGNTTAGGVKDVKNKGKRAQPQQQQQQQQQPAPDSHLSGGGSAYPNPPERRMSPLGHEYEQGLDHFSTVPPSSSTPPPASKELSSTRNVHSNQAYEPHPGHPGNKYRPISQGEMLRTPYPPTQHITMTHMSHNNNSNNAQIHPRPNPNSWSTNTKSSPAPSLSSSVGNPLLAVQKPQQNFTAPDKITSTTDQNVSATPTSQARPEQRTQKIVYQQSQTQTITAATTTTTTKEVKKDNSAAVAISPPPPIAPLPADQGQGNQTQLSQFDNDSSPTDVTATDNTISLSSNNSLSTDTSLSLGGIVSETEEIPHLHPKQQENEEEEEPMSPISPIPFYASEDPLIHVSPEHQPQPSRATSRMPPSYFMDPGAPLERSYSTMTPQSSQQLPPPPVRSYSSPPQSQQPQPQPHAHQTSHPHAHPRHAFRPHNSYPNQLSPNRWGSYNDQLDTISNSLPNLPDSRSQLFQPIPALVPWSSEQNNNASSSSSSTTTTTTTSGGGPSKDTYNDSFSPLPYYSDDESLMGTKGLDDSRSTFVMQLLQSPLLE